MNTAFPQIAPISAEPARPAQNLRFSASSADTPHRELRPVSLHELPALEAQMVADGHSCVLPTQVMIKHRRAERRDAHNDDAQIVGSVSLGAVCLCLPWFDTRLCQPRDSLWFIRAMERHVAGSLPAGHHQIVCVPFGKPFEPFMAKLGYQNAGAFKLGFKKVR